ncbi:MAG: LTA synthase family protein [Bacilli bacterium]|nr:LTA synthase family protein [Bacilli bacterium]
MNKYLKNILSFFINFFTLNYLEILFKIFCINNIFNTNIIHILLFNLIISLIITFITSLFNQKTNKIISNIVLLLITLYFCTCTIYKLKLDVFFSINSLGLANQLVSFIKDTLTTIIKNTHIIIIMFIPFIFTLIFNKKINYNKKNIKELIINTIFLITSIIIFLILLQINKKEEYSAYNLFYKNNNHSLSVEKLGINISTFIEVKNKILNKKEKITHIQENKENITNEVVDYNTLNINFTNSDSEIINSMNEYIKNDSGTNKNKYTGLYKDKNLILIMAESFNSIAVSKELTPTLYKLSNEAFVFENFYSPVILSTIGGEFQLLTGLYPNINLLSKIWRKGNNYFEYGIGNVFNKINYKTFAYHNNQYNFQNRDKYLKSIGFNNYIGCNNGLEKKINCNIWPESDVELIEATTEDYLYINEPFMTYYVTVSGHMNYNWKNAMSKKHKNLVDNLPYSEKVKAYIATQIELDKALEKLILELEKANKLESTVIALVGDHYPYELTIDEINEASNYEKDNIIEINRSNFILWNKNTPTTKIEKIGSQIDVLPTLLNLFGIEYDSRLIVGKDILSNTEGIAIFSNNSWISDKGKYFSNSNKFIPKNNNSIIPENYIKTTNINVNQKILMSKNIIKENYYYYLFKNKETS